MDIDASIFLIGHFLCWGIVNAYGIVLAPPLLRDMEMTWMGYETQNVPRFLYVMTRGN